MLRSEHLFINRQANEDGERKSEQFPRAGPAP
jgi:hypothetical protein